MKRDRCETEGGKRLKEGEDQIGLWHLRTWGGLVHVSMSMRLCMLKSVHGECNERYILK